MAFLQGQRQGRRWGQGMLALCRICILFLLALVLAGCASRNTGAEGPEGVQTQSRQPSPGQPPIAPLGAYALDGPPLHIVGEYKGMPLEGSMERTVMVGLGSMELQSKDKAKGFFCEARVRSEPTEKGRIRGVLDCSEGVVLLFTLRVLGPDQGLAVGRTAAKDDMLVLFFHSSREEAERRFPSVKGAVQAAVSQTR